MSRHRDRRRSRSRDSHDDRHRRRRHRSYSSESSEPEHSRSRSLSRYRSRRRYRSRSRSRHRHRDHSSSKDGSRHSESKESFKTASSSLSNIKVTRAQPQKKQSSWDSLKPVGNMIPELCDMRSAYNKKKAEQKDDGNQHHKIYIGQLDPGCTVDDIRTVGRAHAQVFSSFGEIVNIDLAMDPETNKPKGYCFVEYTKKESVDLALVSLQGFHIKGKPIKLGRPSITASGISVAGRRGPRAGIGAIGYTNPLANPLAAGAVAAATLLQNRSGVRVDTCKSG